MTETSQHALNGDMFVMISVYSTGNTAAATASTVAVQAGFGIQFTPKGSGNIKITGMLAPRQNTAIVPASWQGSYGLVGGGVPSQGAAATGTTVGTMQTDKLSGAAASNSRSYLGKIVGLTAGTAYWFDLQYFTSNASDTLQFLASDFLIEEMYY